MFLIAISVKMEDMEEAEPFMFDKLNFISPLSHSYNKNAYSNPYANYYKNIPPEQIEKLNEIYKTDIEVFEYPNTPFQ